MVPISIEVFTSNNTTNALKLVNLKIKWTWDIHTSELVVRVLLIVFFNNDVILIPVQSVSNIHYKYFTQDG